MSPQTRFRGIRYLTCTSDTAHSSASRAMHDQYSSMPAVTQSSHILPHSYEFKPSRSNSITNLTHTHSKLETNLNRYSGTGTKSTEFTVYVQLKIFQHPHFTAVKNNENAATLLDSSIPTNYP